MLSGADAAWLDCKRIEKRISSRGNSVSKDVKSIMAPEHKSVKYERKRGRSRAGCGGQRPDAGLQDDVPGGCTPIEADAEGF